MSYDEIARAFVERKPIKKRWRTRVQSDNFANAPMHSNSGTIRLDIVGDALLSYEHYELARWHAGRLVINADKPPTRTSSKQQNDLLRALRRVEAEVVYLPYSALANAGITQRDQIKVVATTPATLRVVPVRCYDRTCATPGTHTHAREAHFLGETHFVYRGNSYVSGLDRNDDPRRRNFFLARLPGRTYTTVDAALDALRPPGIRVPIRQGEWFFVPRPNLGVPEPVVRRITRYTRYTYKGGVGRDEPRYGMGVAIRADTAALQREALELDARRMVDERRHVASAMALLGDDVFVRGPIRDREHDTLDLGDVWHRVQRNLAVGSWGATGQVD